MRSGDTRTFLTGKAAVEELERKHGQRSKHWTYTNAGGEPIGMVVRWDTGTKKDIRPIARNAEGLWIIAGMPTPRPLYKLQELLATPAESRIYVTEGEKAADAVRAVGLVATTSPHGSKSASKADWAPLTMREVVILPDNDEAGERYADSVAQLAKTAGAKSVRIIRLIELWKEMPKGGDMADLLEHRGGDVKLVRAEVEALIAKSDAIESNPERSNSIGEFVPFPTDQLPEPIRSLVLEGAKAIGCDEAFVALPMLSALASAIGNSRVIQLKRGWNEPAIVWTAIVGESGTAKSPALELAVRPIRKRGHAAMKAHAEAMNQYNDKLAMHERDFAHWKKSKSITSPPAKPEAPIADRCWTDDATTEAVAVMLQQNPRGMMVVRDELAGWFNFDRYAGGKGGGDVAKWLEMFGGRPMVVDRKTGGTLYVPRASVSIAGGIQPQTLRRALGQENRDNGLAARLLLACPPRKAKVWTEAEVDAKTEAAVGNVFDQLFDLTGEINGDGDEQPRALPLTGAGQRAFVKFYNEHAGEQVNLSGDDAAVWSKLEGYAARLALVIHLVRCVANDPTLRDQTRVDEVSIAAAVKIVRWFGNEALRVDAMLGESDEGREVRRLAEWIERKGGSVTARDLTHGLRAYRDDPDKAERDLTALVEAGIGRWEADHHRPKGGRPTQRFQLVSTVTVTVTETLANPQDSVGFGDGDTGDTPTNAGDR